MPDLNWMRDGKCAEPENQHLDFFTSDVETKYEAKNVCFTCDVRKDCILYAMENRELDGIWGGRDENETRRNLSVSAEGVEVRRNRYPQCPFCAARTSRLITKVVDLPDGGRWTTARVVECVDCGFEWKSRSSANAVVAYFADREERVEKSRKAREKAQDKKQRDKERASARLAREAEREEEREARKRDARR